MEFFCRCLQSVCSAAASQQCGSHRLLLRPASTSRRRRLRPPMPRRLWKSKCRPMSRRRRCPITSNRRVPRTAICGRPAIGPSPAEAITGFPAPGFNRRRSACCGPPAIGASCGGVYGLHAGYWGPHVGFYGGVNYGFGYVGVGFVGGRWAGNSFAYNTAVVNVNTTVMHNTYVNNVTVNNVTVNKVSYNGGAGGVPRRPRRKSVWRRRRRTLRRPRHAAARAGGLQTPRSRPRRMAAIRRLLRRRVRAHSMPRASWAQGCPPRVAAANTPNAGHPTETPPAYGAAHSPELHRQWDHRHPPGTVPANGTAHPAAKAPPKPAAKPKPQAEGKREEGNKP